MYIALWIPSSFLNIYLGSMLVVLISLNMASNPVTELTLFHYWHFTDLFGGLCMSWPIFLWAFAITLLCLLYNSRSDLESQCEF